MKRVKIAGLNDAKSQFTTVSGESFFIPANLRTGAKIGDSALVMNKHFEKSSKRLPDGTVEMGEDNKPILVDQPFDRWQATFIGSLEAAIVAANEQRIEEGVEEAIIAKKQKELAAEYQLEGINAEELIS